VTRHGTIQRGQTSLGVHTWSFPRRPGNHLAWGGPGDCLHLHAGGHPGGLGAEQGTVTGPLHTEAAADKRAAAIIAADCDPPHPAVTCHYSAAHAARGVPATTEIDCGRVGIVPACQRCAGFYDRMAGGPR
jgi:hypothetical protein